MIVEEGSFLRYGLNAGPLEKGVFFMGYKS
jgi:hypothetical protein